MLVNRRDRYLSAKLDVVNTAGQRERSDHAVILKCAILVCHDRCRKSVADQFRVTLSMEERKLSDRVRRKDVLITDVLRVISQTLPLILPCKFLCKPVRNLEVRAAETKHAAQTGGRVKLVVEPEESFS